MTTNIAIVGAGIGGLCSALALAKQGFKVTVFEQSAVIKEVGAGLQLSPNALQVLNALDVSPLLRPYIFRPEKAVMRHYQQGKQYFSVPLAGRSERQYGAPYWHVHRADLLQALNQSCSDNQVKLELGTRISGYEQNPDAPGVRIISDNKAAIEADVLIGADGIHSKIQQTLLKQRNLSSTPRFTGQVAWRGTVKTRDLPSNLVEPNANLWVGPGKHFVSYYLRAGELVNFVAVEERSNWQYESWSKQGDIQQLRALFNDWHPQVREVLAAAQSCFIWALHDREPLTTWVDGNVALLGDACHPMLPFLAQGAAMAIEDSYVLAAMLKKHVNIHDALQQYQNLRLGRTRSIQLQARQNASLYHMSKGSDRAKLAALAVLSGSGLSAFLAAKKLQGIYAHNVVKVMDRIK